MEPSFAGFRHRASDEGAVSLETTSECEKYVDAARCHWLACCISWCGLAHRRGIDLTASSASRARVRCNNCSLSSRAPAAASFLAVLGGRGNEEGDVTEVLGEGGIEPVRGPGVRRAMFKLKEDSATFYRRAYLKSSLE